MLVSRRSGRAAGALLVLLGLTITGQAVAVSSQDTITTVLGTGVAGLETSGGPPQLNAPRGVSLDPVLFDTLYRGPLAVTDTGNARVTAGVGAYFRAFSLPGLLDPSDAIGFNGQDPGGIISDTGHNRIASVSTPVPIFGPNVATLAGTGVAGFSGDGGPAAAAQLSAPGGIAKVPYSFPGADDLYVADTGNNRVRVIRQGVISTFAGNGTAGFSGDGGPATQAALSGPLDIALAPDRVALYIADTGNNRVRRVAPDGTITTVAGNGSAGFSGDGGPATQAALNAPSGVAVDPGGNLYIADTANHRVRRVAPDGTITTVAGSDTATAVGDGGPAGQARLVSPWGLAADADGNLYIADQGDNRVREIFNVPPVAVVTASVQRAAAPVEVTFDAGGSSDPDGRIASYTWRFPSGTPATASGARVTHLFTEPGVYDVLGGIVDDAGGSGAAYVRVTVDPEVTPGGLSLVSAQMTGTWQASRLRGGQLSVSGSVVRAADLRLDLLRGGRVVSHATFSTAASGPFTHALPLGAGTLPGAYTAQLSQVGDRASAPLPVRTINVALLPPVEGVASKAALGQVPRFLVARVSLAVLPRTGRNLVMRWFAPGSRRPVAVHRVPRRALVLDRLRLPAHAKSGTWRAELRWGSRLVATASKRIVGRAR